MSILIVEDNPINAKILALCLAASGYKTVLATDGVEGLACLARHADLELIVTDYMMPGMNGLEFIAKVRQTAAWKHIPFLVASAYSDLEIVQQARDLGCAGFLLKPVDRKQLIDRVAQVLKDVPVVLKAKSQMIATLEISPNEYDDLIRLLVAQLTEALAMVEQEPPHSTDALSEPLNRMFKDLSESATLLGGDQVGWLYARYKDTGGPLTRSSSRALVEALQELKLALEASLLCADSPATLSTDLPLG